MTTTPTPTALAAQQQAVIEAARVIAANLRDREPDDLDMNERELLAAFAALEPYSLPGEPGNRQAVSFVSGSRFSVAHRDDEVAAKVCPDELERHWWIGGKARPRTWSEINEWADEPPTVLMPATDVVDAGIVRELTEALDLMLCATAGGDMPLPSTIHQAQTALARAEGATGGGR